MSATVLPTPASDDPHGDGQRTALIDRLIELRKALHGSVAEVSRLRRANASLRRDVARLERELSAERTAP